MRRSPESRTWIIPARGQRLHAGMVAAVLLAVLLLAYAGGRGHRHARREADLANILFSRDRLQEALDARRTAAAVATRPGGAPADAALQSREVTEWAATLKWRLARFRSTHATTSDVEDLDLRLSEAILAISEGRFSDASSAVAVEPDRPDRGEPGSPDRAAAVLQVRADTCHDTKQWSAALDLYRQILVRHPEDLDVLERMAMCLYSLGQFDAALLAYTDLAKRLHDRGRRLLERLDPGGAVQDLNKAVTIRIWLVEQGRPELTPDLAQSFSGCAAALVELRRFDLARPYLTQALELQAQLIGRGGREDLSLEIASNHAAYAVVLLQMKEPDEAIRHLDRAIDMAGRLIEQGRPGLGSKLARWLADRGLARQARGQPGAAAQDFEKAAEAFAMLGNLAEAVAWQKRAVDLADGEARMAAQLRLDRYRAGDPLRKSSGNGL